MADIVLLTEGRRIEAHVSPSSRGGTAPAARRESREGGGGTAAHGNNATVRIAGREVRLELQRLGPTIWRVVGEDGVAHIARSVEHAGTRWLHMSGETLAVRIGDAAPRRPAAKWSEGLEAPMPGAVTQVAVTEGEIVTAGQPIVIVEAMKMEHVIRAPHAGRVVALRVRQGEQVEAGAVVAELQSADAPATGSQERGG